MQLYPNYRRTPKLRLARIASVSLKGCELDEWIRAAVYGGQIAHMKMREWEAADWALMCHCCYARSLGFGRDEIVMAIMANSGENPYGIE